MEKSSPNGPTGEGARPPIRRILIFAIALAMGLFHIYTAGVRPFPAAQQRAIHLSFALAITFLMFPLRSRKDDAQEAKVSNENRAFSVSDVILLALSFFPGV